MEFVKDNIGIFVFVSVRGKDLRKYSKMKLNNYIYKNNIWMDIIW